MLLVNNGVLPLADSTDIGIIGAFADHPRYQGAGSSQVVPTRLDDARRHAEERFTGRVGYAIGYDPVTGRSDSTRLPRSDRSGPNRRRSGGVRRAPGGGRGRRM